MRIRSFEAGSAAARGLALAGAALVGLASHAFAEEGADPTLAELGAPYYQGYCASCHGKTGHGDGPAAGPLLKPADLTQIAARRGGHFPDAEIAQFIDGRFELKAHGTRQMPVWGDVFTRDIPESDVGESIARGKVLVLVEYLKSIQEPARPEKTDKPVPPAPPEKPAKPDARKPDPKAGDGAQAAPAPGSDREKQTREQMAQIFAAMRYLLPLSLDAARFEDPLEHQHVSDALALLDRSAGSLALHGRSREVPFAHLSRSLSIDARDVHERYEQGHVREARYLIQTLAETCVACHSRLHSAKNAPRSEAFLKDAAVEKLTVAQRAKLAFATRQFDQALSLYEKLLADPSVSANDIDLEGQLDDYLELAIRVKGDPARAQATLERFARRGDLSPALREEVARWQTSLQRMVARGPVARPVPEARTLVEKAEAARPEQDERDALVDYLDASALLHAFVADGRPPHPEQAEAYYLLGEIETRTGRSFWLSQAEAYLETAIRLAPGQPISKDAYSLLEEFLVAGYSGSGGTNVPPDVREKLDLLRKISEGKAPASAG